MRELHTEQYLGGKVQYSIHKQTGECYINVLIDENNFCYAGFEMKGFEDALAIAIEAAKLGKLPDYGEVWTKYGICN